MSFIRTLFQDINPSDAGYILAHEHLMCRPPLWVWRGEDDLLLDNTNKTLSDVSDYKKLGGCTIVDATAIDYGRDVESVAEISRKSGVNIVGTAGFNKRSLWDAPLDSKTSELINGFTNFHDWISKTSVENLGDHVEREITEGLEGTTYRAGQVKFGTSYNAITPLEAKTIEAVAAAHHKTGAPIHSHTEAGTMGLQQMQILKQLEVNMSFVSFGHMDRNLDLWYHRKLADTGCYLVFDGIGKVKYHPESVLIDHILTLVRDGFENQILISGDNARKSYYKSYGHGLGLGYSLLGFKLQFIEMSKEKDLDGLDLLSLFFCKNPQKYLTFKQVL